MGSNRGFRFALMAVVLASAYLRLGAIDWGEPFVYDSREHLILDRALDIARSGDLDPHWFERPSLLIYVEAALVSALHPLFQAPLESNYLVNAIGPTEVLRTQWPYVAAGRIAVALFGIAGVLLLGLAGARLLSPPAGVAAAAFLAVSPLHDRASHFLAVPVPAATLIAAALCLAAGGSLWFVAGALAGLAAGTAYGAVAGVGAVALLAVDRRSGENGARLAWVFSGALLGFAASTPYAFLDAPPFVEAVAGFAPGNWSAAAIGAGWRSFAFTLYQSGTGPVIAALALFGAARAAGAVLAAAFGRGAGRTSAALLLPTIAYLTWVAAHPATAEDGLVLVLPFLCLLAAAMVQSLAVVLRPAWLARGVFAVIAAVAVVTSLGLALEQAQHFQELDTRTQSLRWIEANLPRGSKIAREEFTPQVQAGRYDVRFVPSLALRPYDWYSAEGVQYLVASSFTYGKATGAARRFYDELTNLPLVAEFGPEEGVRGPLIRIFRLPTGPGNGSVG